MDWTFDAGFDKFGNFVVEAHSSSAIMTRVWTAITREELEDIRRTITAALNLWKERKSP